MENSLISIGNSLIRLENPPPMAVVMSWLAMPLEEAMIEKWQSGKN